MATLQEMSRGRYPVKTPVCRKALPAGVLAGVLLISGSLPDNSVPAQAPAAAQDLVWPPPPDPPRMRWLSEFRKFSDIETKKKKRSWFERMAGAPEAEERSPQLISPYGIAVDSRGRVFVADGTAGLMVFDRIVQKGEVWGPAQGIPMRQPLGVTVDEQDRVFFSDGPMHIVVCISKNGKVLAQFGGKELLRPVGLAVDPVRHRLYVADTKAHRIAVFSTETFTFEKYIGGPSNLREPGTFRSPSNVAVDRRGFLYVTDTFNHRVQIFNRQDRFVREFGTQGNGPGQFARPKGIAIDSEGHIYVADAEFNNFQIFDQQGRPLMFVGGPGTGAGQFLLITDLWIDSQDRVYTTERYRSRVQVFQYIPEKRPQGQEGGAPTRKGTKAGLKN